MNNYNFKITRKRRYYEIQDIKNAITILTKNYSFGKNIIWEENIKICNSSSGPMDNVIIGDNVFIGKNTTIMVPSFSIMDYTKINNHFYAHGNSPLSIGYNCWFGSSVILDTLGGLAIGNNVGVGSQTQIYSHAIFGDTLYGCLINSFTPISIEDDVWIAPNSTITSASMSKKSMLLAGSVLIKPTKENHIYSGVPAKDVTGKTGKQFNAKLDYRKIFTKLNRYLEEFYKINKAYQSLNLIRIVMERPSNLNSKYSYFIVKDRRYTKRSTEPEMAFIKFLLPEKAKFIPC